MSLLSKLRIMRNFKVAIHTQFKIEKINEFFKQENLDSVVIGLSGGIDSAVALALYIEASKQPNSPIKKILGLSLPITKSQYDTSTGVTNQLNAVKNARLLYDMYKNNEVLDFQIINLFNAHQSYIIEAPFISNNWARGQLASIVRTPCLYYHAAILQSMGYRSIVSGTTNRDEGAYLGFYGKASDAMVDLQPIADFHKSEVYQIAEYLGLPEEIINATPQGDVHDGKTDFEMIGASYDQIELFILSKEHAWFNDDLYELSKQDWWQNIEKLHNTNEHKYKVGLPSRFIDVLPRKVIGGWQ